MAFISDHVLDNGLNALTTGMTRIDICSSEPATYTAATSTASLGNKTAISVAAPSARSGGGRKVTVAAISGGAVTANGTATHQAGTDPANSRLLETAALTSSQAVTSGNTFSLAAFDIGIPGAV